MRRPYRPIGILGFGDFEILEYWNIGMLGFGDFEILGYWKYWNIEIWGY